MLIRKQCLLVYLAYATLPRTFTFPPMTDISDKTLIKTELFPDPTGPKFKKNLKTEFGAYFRYVTDDDKQFSRNNFKRYVFQC